MPIFQFKPLKHSLHYLLKQTYPLFYYDYLQFNI